MERAVNHAEGAEPLPEVRTVGEIASGWTGPGKDGYYAYHGRDVLRNPIGKWRGHISCYWHRGCTAIVRKGDMPTDATLIEWGKLGQLDPTDKEKDPTWVNELKVQKHKEQLRELLKKQNGSKPNYF